MVTQSEQIEALRAEVLRQWEYNHFEHCQRAWPHRGICHWALPSVLGETSTLEIVDELHRHAGVGDTP